MHHKLTFTGCYLNEDSNFPYNTKNFGLFIAYNVMKNTCYDSSNIRKAVIMSLEKGAQYSMREG